MIFFSRFLSILPSGYLFYARAVPCPDITLSGGDGQADGLDNGFELLGVELIREGIPEGFQEKGLLCLAHIEFAGGGRKFLRWPPWKAGLRKRHPSSHCLPTVRGRTGPSPAW